MKISLRMNFMVIYFTASYRQHPAGLK